MKKLLGILVLGLLWCNIGFAKCKMPIECVFKNDEEVTKSLCKGSHKFSDGSIFKGTWSRGKKLRGTLTYANGDIYTGDFGHGKRHDGGGTLLKINGDKYVGVWEFDKLIIGTYNRDSTPVEYFPKNKKIIKKNNIKKWKAFKYILDEGTFEKGKGIIFYYNGSIYVGEFKEGKRDGHGRLYSPKGTGHCNVTGMYGPWKDDEWRGVII